MKLIYMSLFIFLFYGNVFSQNRIFSINLETNTIVYSITNHSTKLLPNNNGGNPSWINTNGFYDKYISYNYKVFDEVTTKIPVILLTYGTSEINFRIYCGNKSGVGIGVGQNYIKAFVDFGFNSIYNSVFIEGGITTSIPISKDGKYRFIINTSIKYMPFTTDNAYFYYNVSRNTTNNIVLSNIGSTNYIKDVNYAFTINLIQLGFKFNFSNITNK